jgi:hypothetical protein
MTRSRESIISRIRACLKLAAPETNSNEHERATARRVAYTLASKYKITAEELKLADSGIPESVVVAENLNSVFAALKKCGATIKRGWMSTDTPKGNPTK